MSCRTRFPIISSVAVGMTYGILEENDMNVGRKDFVGDWVVHHSFGVLTLAPSLALGGEVAYLEEVELDELACIQWFSRYRIYTSACPLSLL